ncbi:MAG: YciI family protein [Rhodospirillales bacterium]|jgi:uncharacterized protein|nr:YciI family protein [Rhodospirillales bacterium]
MLYAIICHDKNGASSVRAENRPDHLDYLKGFADRAHAVGPMLSDDGADMVGSLLIMNFDSMDDAASFAEGDPYNKAGLFDSVTIKAWKQVLPAL